MLYACSGVGDSSVHSSVPDVCADELNSAVDVKNAGTAHGLAGTTLSCSDTNRSYTTYPNTKIAATEMIDPTEEM